MYAYSDTFLGIILGLVEGLTEFLPISSTGHLILAGHLLGFEDERAKSFEIFIQLGAILAVVVLYFQRFLGLLRFDSAAGFHGKKGIALLALGCLPVFVLGALFHHAIKELLFGPKPVAAAMIAGGILIFLAERCYRPAGDDSLDTLSFRQALTLGLFQCLALWSGFSRSGSMMIGGLFLGLRRSTAAEFSFIVAVPVMCAATLLDLYKSLPLLQSSDTKLFAIGFAVSFFTALVAIKTFLALLARITLLPFAVYRIALGILVILLF